MLRIYEMKLTCYDFRTYEAQGVENVVAQKVCMMGWRNQNYTSEIYFMRDYLSNVMLRLVRVFTATQYCGGK